jgi:phosphatidylcholine synthase
VDAKTDDHFFLGFPSYWNVVAFYVIVVGLSHTTTALILVICSALVFVPIKYIYPSRTRAFRTANLLLTAMWLITYAVMLLQMPNPNDVVIALSLGYLLYYAASSIYLTLYVAPRTARSNQAGVSATGHGD